MHDTITKVAFSYQRQVFAMPGRFDKATMRMLEDILEVDSSMSHTEPDSSNTRIFWLNAWPVTDETVLIETCAGNTKGSCGAQLVVARYSESTGHWVKMFDQCGAVDTILPISHNGLLDFIICDKWDMDHWAYRFDGSKFVEMSLFTPQSDYFRIHDLVSEMEGYGPIELTISYLNLGKDSMPIIVTGEGIGGKYFFTRNTYGEAVFLCEFPDAAQIDFLETEHNGMPDIRTFDTTYKYGFYEWDGKEYVRVREEKWYCPA